MSFIVYALLNPLKSECTFGEFYFPHEPFYIGKGRPERPKDHMYEKKGNRIKIATINNIKKSGNDVIIHVIKDGLSEGDAFDLEVHLIGLIGRRNLKTGPLANMTSGGTGGDTLSSHPRKAELYENLRLRNTGKGNPFYGKTHTPEVRKRVGEATKRRTFPHPMLGKPRPESTRKKISDIIRNRPEHEANALKERISKKLTGRKNPEHSAFMKKHCAENKEKTQEKLKKLQQGSLDRWERIRNEKKQA